MSFGRLSWLYFCYIGFLCNLGTWVHEPTLPNFIGVNFAVSVFSVLIVVYDSFTRAVRGAISQESVEYVEATPELKEKMERHHLKQLEKRQARLMTHEKKQLIALQAKYNAAPENEEETT